MKNKVKIGIDILMTVLLYFLMARQLTGDPAHEWLGAVTFLLWIIHHIWNRRWFSHLFQGKYTPVRMLQTVINVALLVVMLIMMVSGILLSREVFCFLPVSGGRAVARLPHIIGGFWCFVLMSLHLGLHWNRMIGMFGKNENVKPWILRVMAAVVAFYGLWAFIKNQFMVYMFGQSHFVFFDFERPVFLFVTEYMAIMGFFIWVAHYGMKGILWWLGRKKR